MKVSANEVTILSAKAARGAGAPPAQAAAFGRAALFHLAAHRPERDLVAALDALPLGPILTLPIAFARVMTEIADIGMLPRDISAPLLHSYAEAQPFTTVLRAVGPALQATVDTAKPSPFPTLSRITLSDDLHDLLNHLAARTLVPESETSRLGGAGAGLTDND